MEGDRRQHWHLDKNISVGHLLTTLALAGSVLVWAMSMDTRVTVLEAELAHSQKYDERMERDWRETMQKLESALIRIEAKLDGKADKRK